MTDFSSGDRLQRAFEGARTEAQINSDLTSQLLSDLAEVQQKAAANVKDLQSQLRTLQASGFLG